MNILSPGNYVPVAIVAVAIFTIFLFFNTRVGPALWKIKKLRPTLKVLEAIKLIWPPLIGATFAFLPIVPRPEAISDQPVSVIVFAYFMIGVHTQWIVKGCKKALEARGIDVDLDLSPLDQKDQGCYGR